MITGTAKPTSTPNVRVRKGLNGNPDPAGMTVGAIQPNQAFKGSEKKESAPGQLWIHITEVGGKPIDGWSAAYLLNWTETDVIPDPVDTTPAPVPYTITLGDDVTYGKVTYSGVLQPK